MMIFIGRLVIDSNCKTNDPNIYGAGTLTKYSRKYYSPNSTHKYYSRIEIGRRLGFQIREMLIQQKVSIINKQAFLQKAIFVGALTLLAL